LVQDKWVQKSGFDIKSGFESKLLSLLNKGQHQSSCRHVALIYFIFLFNEIDYFFEKMSICIAIFDVVFYVK